MNCVNIGSKSTWHALWALWSLGSDVTYDACLLQTVLKSMVLVSIVKTLLVQSWIISHLSYFSEGGWVLLPIHKKSNQPFDQLMISDRF